MSEMQWKAVCARPAGPRNNHSSGFQLTSHQDCDRWFFCSTADRSLHKMQGVVAARLPGDSQVDRDSSDPPPPTVSPTDWAGCGCNLSISRLYKCPQRRVQKFALHLFRL